MGFDAATDSVIGTFKVDLSQGQSQTLKCFDTYDVISLRAIHTILRCVFLNIFICVDCCYAPIVNWKEIGYNRVDSTGGFRRCRHIQVSGTSFISLKK